MRSTLVLLSLLMGAQAFSPSSYSAYKISQIEKDNYARFAPLAMDEDDDLAIEEPDEEDYIVNVGDLEGDDEESGIEDDGQPPAWAVSQQRIDEMRAQYRRNDKDTGSPEYQAAGMTERINYLTNHLKEHPKDFSTRRGLVALVNKRRRLLNYLYAEDVNRYKDIVSSLGIRHKAPGRVSSREEKYNRFPVQKALKKHLIKKNK